MRGIVLFCCPALLCLTPACSSKKLITTSNRTDSVRIQREIEYVERLRDTVIYVPVPAERSEIASRADSSFLETSLAASQARIQEDGTLSHTLYNKPQSIAATVAVKERETITRDEKETGSHMVVELPVRLPLRNWEKFLLWCGAAFCIIAAGTLLVWITRLAMRRRL